MQRKQQITLARMLGIALLAGALGYAVGAVSHIGDTTEESTSLDGGAESRPDALAVELRARDEELARLHAENELLERRLAELALPRAPATAEPEPRPEPEPATEADAPVAPGAGSLVAATAWLRNALPERFGSITPEEAAMMLTLDLRGAELTDADLAHLAVFTRLQNLGLRGTAITDAGLHHLGSLGQLESLDLRGTGITGQSLGLIPTRLRSLHLTHTKVTGADLYRLPLFADLQQLKLNAIAFGDADVDGLVRFPNVQHLELDQTALTDTGLRQLLAQQPNLRRIELRGTQVTSDAVRELAERYSGCEFVLD